MENEKQKFKSEEFETYKREFEDFIRYLQEWANDEKDQRFDLQNDGLTWMDKHGFGTGFNPLSVKQRMDIIWEWIESNDSQISKYNSGKSVVACFIREPYLNMEKFYRIGKNGIYLYESEGFACYEYSLMKRRRFRETIQDLLKSGYKLKYSGKTIGNHIDKDTVSDLEELLK
jgi:hypothetical protein